ncbi:MAG TPA: ParB/RepB/Spo0J family partition protein [Terriglobales bacterium]|nr:ParB/RepB/Spo0J family partition protein [Terriglobales bacterium]
MEDRLAIEKTSEKRRALGRGLDSLLPAGPRVVAVQAVVGNLAPVASAEAGVEPLAMPPDMASRVRVEAGEAIVQIALDQIDENPYQTRRIFDPKTLESLADSIRSNGVVQPVVVRRSAADRFALILGERRCRAAKLAGQSTIPALIRQVSNQQAAEMTVIENLQRQDLNCLEQAHAFARLSRDFGLTQEQIGQRTGCSRESVSNYMRLLRLPPEVQQFLADGKLGFSEARVLLQLTNPDSIPHFAKEAVEKSLSVAQLTALVDYANLPGPGPSPDSPRARWVDPNVRAIQSSLEQILGCKVRISDRKGKGKILIEYASLEDFDRIVEMLKGK